MEKILDVVIAQLRTGDENLIKVADVSRMTGVTYGSLYNYFGSREGLLAVAYERLLRDLAENDIGHLERMIREATSREDFYARVATLVDAFADHEARRESRALKLRILSVALTRPSLLRVVADVQQEFTDRFSAVLQLAQDRDWFRSLFDARLVATSLQALMFGATLDDASAKPLEPTEWSGLMKLVVALFLVPDPLVAPR